MEDNATKSKSAAEVLGDLADLEARLKAPHDGETPTPEEVGFAILSVSEADTFEDLTLAAVKARAIVGRLPPEVREQLELTLLRGVAGSLAAKLPR